MDANERRERATHEATQWWNRLVIEKSSEISKADRESFTEWLRESPLHVAELLRIAHVHDALERFDLWAGVATGVTDEASNVVPLREVEEPSREIGARPARSRVWVWAVAAGTCLVGILGIWLALGSRDEVIATELAERRQIMLDDGTVVQLEPETKLRVKFEERERLLVLDRGRALFRVAKDPQRPFRVSTNDTSVRAVGTAFGVESGEQGVIVTVAEGKVAVWRSSSEAGAQPLVAGQQLTVHSSGTVEPVRSVDTARALAWAQGQLVFENDTLARVIEEFNRYNRTQLRISDPQLAARRVSGVFEATDTETLLAFIRQGGDDIAITQSDESIVITSNSR